MPSAPPWVDRLRDHAQFVLEAGEEQRTWVRTELLRALLSVVQAAYESDCVAHTARNAALEELLAHA